MILAAGRGERLRPLTDYVPKPLLQVGGETLIGRHLRALSSAGVRQVVVNTAWLGGMLTRQVASHERFGLEVQFSDEGDNALETGGGIYRALPRLGSDPFIVLNGDIWADMDLTSLVRPDPGDLATLVLVPNPPNHPKGDFALSGDRVVAEGERLTYTGIAILRRELFADCSPTAFPLAPLLRQAIRDRRVRGQRHDGAWFDCGSIERLDAARNHARRLSRNAP